MQNPRDGRSGGTLSGGGQDNNNNSSDDEVESLHRPDNGPRQRSHTDLEESSNNNSGGGEAGPSLFLVPISPRSLPDNIRTQEDFFPDMAEALNKCFNQHPPPPLPRPSLLPLFPCSLPPSPLLPRQPLPPPPPRPRYVPLLERTSNYQYQCAICLVKFFNMRALCGHMRMHPDRGWKGITPPPDLLLRPRGFVEPTPFFQPLISRGLYRPPLGGGEPGGDDYLWFPRQKIQWPGSGPYPDPDSDPLRIGSGDDNERMNNEEESRERLVDKSDKGKGQVDAGTSTDRKRKWVGFDLNQNPGFDLNRNPGFDLNRNPDSASPPSDEEEKRKKKKEEGGGGTQSDD